MIPIIFARAVEKDIGVLGICADYLEDKGIDGTVLRLIVENPFTTNDSGYCDFLGYFSYYEGYGYGYGFGNGDGFGDSFYRGRGHGEGNGIDDYIEYSRGDGKGYGTNIAYHQGDGIVIFRR